MLRLDWPYCKHLALALGNVLQVHQKMYTGTQVHCFLETLPEHASRETVLIYLGPEDHESNYWDIGMFLITSFGVLYNTFS